MPHITVQPLENFIALCKTSPGKLSKKLGIVHQKVDYWLNNITEGTAYVHFDDDLRVHRITIERVVYKRSFPDG